MTGTFFAVVGPSGAGKDTLIDYARDSLAGDGRFSFPRRVISRPADAGGEEHVAVSEDEFARLRSRGAFLIDWQAHGLSYGIPSEAAGHLEAGDFVVANLSRSALEPLQDRVSRLRTVHVTAPLEVIARRLSERGRESAGDIERRLERAGYAVPSSVSTVTICNGGPVDEAGEAFVALLKAAAA